MATDFYSVTKFLSFGEAAPEGAPDFFGEAAPGDCARIVTRRSLGERMLACCKISSLSVRFLVALINFLGGCARWLRQDKWANP